MLHSMRSSLASEDKAGARRLIEAEVVPFVSKRTGAALSFDDLADCTTQRANYDFTFSLLARNNGIDAYHVEAKRCRYPNNIVVELWGVVEGQHQNGTHYVGSAEHIELCGRAMDLDWDSMLGTLGKNKPGLVFDDGLPPNHLYLYRKKDNRYWLFESRRLASYLRGNYREYDFMVAQNRGYYSLGVLLPTSAVFSVDELRAALWLSGSWVDEVGEAEKDAALREILGE
jgi:hypothetical protein